MNKDQNKNNLDNFSDINDDIIIKEGDNFQVFSQGNLSDLDLAKLEEKKKFPDSNEVLDTGMEEINLAPPAPVVWDKKSSFYFDTEDEDDINKEVKKIKKIEKQSFDLDNKRETKKYSLTKILKKLLENYNLNLLPELEKRLSNIVLSFLKHTRARLDVLNLFKAPINQSGLALEGDLAGKLIDLLEKIRFKIDESAGIIIEDRKDDKVSEIKLSSPLVKNLANIDPRQKIKAEPRESVIPIVQRTSVSHNKPMVTGIKKKEKVIGPTDEFSEITLLAFRRLSKDPIEAAQKIIDKIRSLEKES